MSAWRAHKRAAARALHATMGVPAVYLTTLDGAPLRVEVRVHTDIRAVDFGRAAFDEAFSGFVDDTPKLIFDQDEVECPLSRSWVIVGPEEMYRIGPSRPPKSGQTAVEVTPLIEAALDGMMQRVIADSELQGDTGCRQLRTMVRRLLRLDDD